ncbi:MAG: DUF1786 domain-containing protein [Euryarchaeota archaeon]|nr:DUF1786 domain-containing protein [Euryarchaeota archaeon]
MDINAAKKILALDVGSGTLDILLYDKRKNLENCTKMVLPSPSIVFAKQVQKATRNRKHIFIDGDVIGGGAFAFALKKHVEKGYKVLMTENAAYTVRNDLDQVRNLGIEIVGKEPVNFDGIKLIIKEIDLGELKNFFEKIGEDLSDLRVVAIAVQDHGVSPKGISDRVFRFEKIKDLLKKNQRLESFAFKENEIPRYFVRMRSAVKAVKRDLPNAKVIVMDTAPAAFLGCLKDPRANYIGNLMAVNVGNGHTTAALISDGKIDGIFEHHTGLLSPNKLEGFLVRFANGSLTNKEVLDDGGHGVYVLNSLGFGSLKAILVTGPKRSIFNKTHLKFHFASPGGDVMMAGTVGLIEAAHRRLEIRW